ncbi:MAG: ketopantoate reductase family protein [Anaerolineae bacterium]
MKIAIIGAGAMGSLFGARLAPLCDVWLVDAWEEHIQAIQRNGVQLTNLDGSTERVTVNATTDPNAVEGEVDLAIIFVKSHQTAQAAVWAAPMLKADGLALTMQNGLGNLEVMADVLGAERCVQGVTSHGATLLGPGQVRHAGAAATYLATRPAIAERVQRIAELFTRAGFETHLSDNLDSLLWGKLIINVGINALTAILRVRNGVLAEVAPARALMDAAVDEAVAVARARGITLPYADARARTREVAVATAANRSSMLADVLRGSPTEIEVINGAIVREGSRLGVATPVNQTLVQLVQALEATYAQRVA